MTNQLPAMQSGSTLVIKIDGVTLAYAQSMAFSDRMATAPVGGIGSFSYDALEPLQYSASGSMVITQYSKAAFDAIGKITSTPNPTTPGRVNSVPTNTMLRAKWFSPVTLMVSKTFDLDVYNRVDAADPQKLELVYKLEDCRMNSYSMTFTPGSIVQENIGYLCLRVIDVKYESQQ